MPTDIVSENRLRQLHPAIRDKAIAAYREAVRTTPVGVHPYITEGMRSFRRSDELWAQGRTTPGNIVTNAPGGQSYHNYGLAIDFVNQVNGLPKWVIDDNWMKVVNAFKKYGFVWGGDFKSIKDNPHFEMTFGLNWRELMKRRNEGKVDKNGYVIL
jgi:peptidoglycan L-alanyl-D-glutamate endopeptidase CwlK